MRVNLRQNREATNHDTGNFSNNDEDKKPARQHRAITPPFTMRLVTTHKDMDEQHHEDLDVVEFTEALFPRDTNDDVYDDSSVRKAIATARYVNFCRNLIVSLHKGELVVDRREFASVPTPPMQIANRRQPLRVDAVPGLAPMLNDFIEYYEREVAALQDPAMEDELQLLYKIRRGGGNNRDLDFD